MLQRQFYAAKKSKIRQRRDHGVKESGVPTFIAGVLNQEKLSQSPVFARHPQKIKHTACLALGGIQEKHKTGLLPLDAAGASAIILANYGVTRP